MCRLPLRGDDGEALSLCFLGLTMLQGVAPVLYAKLLHIIHDAGAGI